jgi:hypothetical protein
MSFSFTVRGPTAAQALEVVAAKLDLVVSAQPAHRLDAEVVKATAASYASLLPEEEGQDVTIACHGYVTCTGDANDPYLTGASVGVSVYLTDKV